MIARENLLAMTETGATATGSAAGSVSWSFAGPTPATPPASTCSAAGMDVVSGSGMIVVQRYEYTGRELASEASGYYFFRYRSYGPALGQFFTRDPLGYVDGLGLYAGWFAGALTADPMGEQDSWQSGISPPTGYPSGPGLSQPLPNQLLATLTPPPPTLTPPPPILTPGQQTGCCKAAYAQLPEARSEPGLTICCKGTLVGCSFPQELQATNPTAIALISQCTVAHEAVHVADIGKQGFRCDPCKPLYAPSFKKPFLIETECNAYRKSLNCLKKAKSQCRVIGSRNLVECEADINNAFISAADNARRTCLQGTLP